MWLPAVVRCKPEHKQERAQARAQACRCSSSCLCSCWRVLSCVLLFIRARPRALAWARPCLCFCLRVLVLVRSPAPPRAADVTKLFVHVLVLLRARVLVSFPLLAHVLLLCLLAHALACACSTYKSSQQRNPN